MLVQKIPAFFKQRREALLSRPEAAGAAFLFPAAPEYIRNNDVHHPFRQDSNFYYFSGFDEPESFLLLLPKKTVLFVRKRDQVKEMWEGERYGVEGAVSVFGADEAYLIEEFESKMPDLLKGVENLYYRANVHEAEDRKVFGVLETLRRSYGRSGRGIITIKDPADITGELRLRKNAEEIEFMRKACSLTAAGHKMAMMETRPGMNEFEIEAMVDYAFRKGGCQRLGYGSIVAGGKNATCLHYRSNNEELRDGELLLIDAGGEYQYYTSDITRTFPIGRAFSKAQAKIYDLVLKSQLACIEIAKPGRTLVEIHQMACAVLTEGLLDLGLLKGSKDAILKSGEFRRFFPHGTGHWLGMDVHDAGLYLLNGEPRKLEKGMMFTIEPGLYVQPTDKDAPSEYRHIGIRIEDDILITDSGCEIMTAGVPKAREEVEALRKF
jgi:Xaa-Pro aminopeptidase